MNNLVNIYRWNGPIRFDNVDPIKDMKHCKNEHTWFLPIKQVYITKEIVKVV